MMNHEIVDVKEAYKRAGIKVKANEFTPVGVQIAKNTIEGQRIPVYYMFLGASTYKILITETKFIDWFDPSTETNVYSHGYCGVLFGTAVYTDAFLPENERIFDPDLIEVASQRIVQ